MGVNLLATSMTRDILAASDLIVGDALVIERHAPFSRGTPELMSTLVEIPSSPCFI
jgi:hypothetical protein